jgi:hypothetical protein
MSAVSAKGLFRAMGKNRKARVVDLIDGEAVRSDEVVREKDDFTPQRQRRLTALFSMRAKGCVNLALKSGSLRRVMVRLCVRCANLVCECSPAIWLIVAVGRP